MKKCLVLDLDNTLWGGIIGEDGMEGIKLDAPFIAFQQAILDLANRGIILAVNSKNNFEDAIKVFREHPNMILKENHIAAWRINWNDKATNIRELAQELNIGLDSMVFLDDDETNRVLVRGMVPEVEVPDFPNDPNQYASFLIRKSNDYKEGDKEIKGYFKTGVLTDEDKMRNTLYTTELLRKREEQKFNSKIDFLKSLGIYVDVFVDSDSYVPRLSQMTGKTNQFNNKKAELISEDDIKKYIADSNYAVFHASSCDKFGDHGVIALALVEKNISVWKIKSLLMSCRILGNGIEETFLSYIKKIADLNPHIDPHTKILQLELGSRNLHIEFDKTEKNQPMEDFVKKYFDDNFNLKTDLKLDTPPWVKLTEWYPMATLIS